MLAITRHRVREPQAAGFLDAARRAVDVLAQRPGFVVARIGRATDDGELWVLATEWADVGSYRRALSAYEVKIEAVQLLSTAIDEPTAFEVLTVVDSTGTRSTNSARAADADTVGRG